MEKLTQEQLDLIKKPLPDEAVSKHPTKIYLSSIKAIYVTERLNDVFWVWAWQIKTDKISENTKGMVVVKTILEIPTYWIYYESFGWNDNWWEASKNFDLWDAYKWATTDAITKIASYIWIWIDVFKWKQKWIWSSEVTNDKPKEEIKWYNDFEKQKDMMKDKIADWTSPDDIIKSIENKWYKISSKIKESIKNL